jgi:hypothetical protein
MPFETIYKELRVPVFQNPRTSDFMVFLKEKTNPKSKNHQFWFFQKFQRITLNPKTTHSIPV